jgi:PAS domain S-box-containing protein
MSGENASASGSTHFASWLARILRGGGGASPTGNGASGGEPALADSEPPVDALLVESESRYKAVIENASDMIQSVRMDGTFEFVNRAWHDKLGYTEDDLPGMVIWDIIHPDSLEHCQALFSKVMQGTNLANADAVFITKDGRAVPAEGSATNRIVDGKIVATHAFFRDVTEKLRAKDLEEENLRLEQEKRARYLEKMAALGKLSAGLSHELNNPAAAAQRASDHFADSMTRRDDATRELMTHGLSVEQCKALMEFGSARVAESRSAANPLETSQQEDEIERWLEDHGISEAWNIAPVLVQAGITSERLTAFGATMPDGALPAAIRWIGESVTMRNQANIIMRSTRRISELVGAVKAYSFMDQATEQDVDIHDGIEDTLVILAHRLRNITIKREYDRSLPTVSAHGSGLNQVWTNIIDNAADATGGTGTITIRTGRVDDRAMVEITDNGPGISAEDITCVFEPFFTTKAQGVGTGLGLNTVWRIVTDEHDGTVEVESVPGATTFRVLLPLSAPA